MNTNKIKTELQGLGVFFPLLETQAGIEKIIATEEFQARLNEIRSKFKCFILVFVDYNYVHFLAYDIYSDVDKGLAVRIIY